MTTSRFMMANWKMNLIESDIEPFFQTLNKNLTPEKFQKKSKIQTLIFPQAIYLSKINEHLQKNSYQHLNLSLGVQNIGAELKGAYTGEISLVSAVESGARTILIGHSERRTLFGETENLVNKKCLLVSDYCKKENIPLKIVLCIGETQQERESENHFQVIKNQLFSALNNLTQNDLIIAYEPVWAIGTGLTATPEQIQEIHQFIKETLIQINPIWQDTPVVYGGSVNRNNANQILSLENVSGALVGGASIDASHFSELISTLDKLVS